MVTYLALKDKIFSIYSIGFIFGSLYIALPYRCGLNYEGTKNVD
jgi:hypothetical protein